MCYWEFTDHGNLDHWSIKIWKQIEQQKITLEAFEKGDEASTDREHNVDDTFSNNDIEGLEEPSHKVDIHLHEGNGDNEVKKKETIESDITHEKKSKNDETEVESNGKRIRRPIEILMGGLNMISITQT